MKEKFPPGIANIIKNILQNKDSVRVVPLGLSYNDTKNSMGSIHIGDTIVLKNVDNEIFYTKDAKEKISLGNINNRTITANIVKLLSSKLEDSVISSKINV